jgi:hypothetical protein
LNQISDSLGIPFDSYFTLDALGWQMINARYNESGKVRATRELFGAD